MAVRVIRSWMLAALVGCAPAGPGLPAAGDGLPAVVAEVITEGGLRKRLAGDDGADVVIFYGGEQEGSVETCGCPVRPRGSLARVGAYVSAAEAPHEGRSLLVNTGAWLDDTIGVDGRLRPDVVAMNAWMLRGLDAGSWDALNVTWQELPYLRAVGFPSAAVSANVRPKAADVPSPARFRVVDGVAVTGVTAARWGFLAPPDLEIIDPLDALREVLPEMIARSDVVVVLAYAVGGRAAEIAALPGVDVVVEADRFEATDQPWVDEDTVWVRSRLQTQRLGELRLRLSEGTVVAARDRQIDMDDRVPSDRALLDLEQAARLEIEALQQGMW